MNRMHRKLGILAALSLAASTSHASPLWSQETHDLYLADFDGDGRTDILYVAKDPSQSSGILLSTASSGAGGNVNQTWPGNYLGIPWGGGTYKVIVADFNGDHRADILLQRQTPGDHYILFANAHGQFDAIGQTIPDNTGGQLWSAAAHRIVAGDFNGDGRADLFLQSVTAPGLHVLFLADYATGTFGSAQQSWNDGQFGFAWSLSKANVYAGDFNGDGKADLFVQRKPDLVIINFDIPFPVPTFPAESFGLVQGKVLYQGQIFYPPILDSWSRKEAGIDWSGANYRAVVADYTGDGRADIFLQGKNSAFPNHLMTTNASGQLNSADSLLDAGLRAYSQQQGLAFAGNFDGTPAFGVYLQAATAAGTNQYADTVTTSTVVLTSHLPPPVSTPPAQTYRRFMTASRFNAAGQVTATIAPDPDDTGPLRFSAVRNTYDTAGRLVRIETGELSNWVDDSVDPKDWPGFSVQTTREISFDGYGRPTKKIVRDADGVAVAASQMSYDPIGEPDCKTVRMNPAIYASLPADACALGAEGAQGPDRVSKTSYNLLGQLLSEKRAVGTSLEQTYVTNVWAGRLLISQKDANGNKTSLDYDSYGRLWHRYYPSPDFVGEINQYDLNVFTYDENGNVKTEQKRSGALITYTYDALNRPTKKDLGDNTYSPDVFLDYDLRGLLLHSTFTSDTGLGIYNTFEGLGRLAMSRNTLNGVNRDFNYEYDLDGDRTKIIHPDGNYFTYAFDDVNRVKEIKQSGSTSLLAIEYYPNGRRKAITRMSGAGATTSFQYLRSQRLDSFTQNFTGTADDLTNGFTYNPVGQVVQLTQGNTLYAYSGNANLSGNYIPNGLNQTIKIGTQTISYDTNGNLTNDGTLGATYDLENHLVATTGPAATLKYDPLGRLAEYTAGGATTQFVYDGDALVLEYTGTGSSATLSKRYVHGDQIDEPLVQYSGTTLGTRRFLHADQQGSIVAQSDDSGAAVQKLAYDSYGIPAAGNSGRFGFTGQIWLPEIGLFHYKSRVYSPKLGRFLQTDPIGYKDNLNMYAYAGDDPINKLDPSGMSCTVTGEGKETKADCKVDDRGNLSDRQYKQINQAYSAAVTRLLRAKSSKEVDVTVKGDGVNKGGTFKANANEQGRLLAKAFVSVSAQKDGVRAQTKGGPLLKSDRDDGQPHIALDASITQSPGGGASAYGDNDDARRSHDIQVTLIHESFHLSPGESAMYDLYHNNYPFFKQEHNQPYDDAAYKWVP